MSVKKMSEVWALTGLQGTKKLVLLALADNANDEGISWPSLTTISRKCGLTRRGVTLALEFLEKSGFISRSKTEHKSTTYNITFHTRELHSLGNSVPHTREPNSLELGNSVPKVGNSVPPNHKEPSIEPPLNREQKSKVWNPTEEQLRLGAIFRRKKTTPFSPSELKAWRAITPVDLDDLKAVEKWHAATPQNGEQLYRRTALETVLRNWQSEVDRARAWQPKREYNL